jgi:crossover junction endodeoxyribonuclease RusA
MTEVTITLPLAPSINHYKKAGRLTTTKTGKVYQPRVNTEVTKRFYYEVWYLVRQLGIESLGDALLSLEMDIHPASNRRMDIDNRIKITLDALQRAGLYDDDTQIHRLLVERKGIIPQGQIIVRVRNL